jgi:large conductance mechanosensitive channel
MLKGFRDFIMRGNVVDLAVGIVIGAAFTALVASLTSSFLNPLIGVLGGGKPGSTGAVAHFRGQSFTWGAFINSVITFLLTAAALYFLVVFPMNKLAERRKRGEVPPPEAPSEEIRLLTDIRDALVGRSETPAISPADAMPPREPGRS